MPGEAERFLTDFARAEMDAQHRGLWRHLKKDGSTIEVEITSLDLVYAARPACLVLAHDVTAQRLLQKQLLQAQRMEITTQMAGGVVDNFSRLLQLIEEDASTLLRSHEHSDAAQPLKRIAATAASAGGLTRQLMALVRRHPIQVEPVDLNEFIESRQTRITRLVGNKISLEVSCRENLPSIVADPALLDQILHNLVMNARDALTNGGTLTLSTGAVRIERKRIRAHDEARPGTFVCLTVADTGCGMTPEVQARLFEPFFTTKARRKATGLGLATVHGLVKQHAGWIEVETNAGEGSKFTVFFPCGQAGAGARAATQAPGSPQPALASLADH